MNQKFKFSVNTEGEKAKVQLSGDCTIKASVDSRSNARHSRTRDVKTSLSSKARKKVMVTDEVAAVTWLLKKRLLHCLRMPPLAVNKTEVRKLLDLGVDVPGLAFEDGETKNDADNRQKGR